MLSRERSKRFQGPGSRLADPRVTLTGRWANGLVSSRRPGQEPERTMAPFVISTTRRRGIMHPPMLSRV
jgi:hypothetical protein